MNITGIDYSSNTYGAMANDLDEEEAKKEQALRELHQANRQIAALKALRSALVNALQEVAPNHPLTNKEFRNEIIQNAFDQARP